MRLEIKDTDHKNERTLIIVKPDGVQRGLVGEVIQRVEKVGLKLVGLKLVVPTRELVEKHYTTDSEWIPKTGAKNIKNYMEKGVEPPTNDPIEAGKKILDTLVDYMTSGPVVAMVWQGAHAVKVVKKISGVTEPLAAAVGTIRGDMGVDSYEMTDTQGRAVRNVIHASGTIDEAKDEISHWFNPNEIIEYKTIHEQVFYHDFSDLLGK